MAKKPNPILDDSDIQNFKSVERSVTNISSTLNDMLGVAKEFSKAFATTKGDVKSLASKITQSIAGIDKLGSETAKFVEKIRQGTATQAEFNRLQTKLKNESAKINVSYNTSFNLLKKLSGSQEDITKAAGKINVINDSNVKLLSTQADIAQKLKQLNNESDPVERKKLATQIVSLRNLEKQLKSSLRITETLQDTVEESEKLDKLYGKIGNSFDKINARSKDIKQILDTVSKIPIIKNFINVDKLRESLERAKGDTNIMKLAFKEIAAQTGAALRSPLVKFGFYLTIFKTTLEFYKKLAKAVLEQDKAITELGKNIGIAKDEAILLYRNFAAYSRESSKAYITSIELVNANNELNEQLNSGVAFTADILDNYITFTKAIGLSKEAFVGLNLLAFKNGQTFESTEKSVIRTVNRQLLQGKVTASYRKVLDQVGKVSANIAMSFGSIPGKIAEGILAAKQLGLTLEQTSRVGETLLDFQSSIESELQAELLTGKQINLERARAAYLYNDQITFLKEINKEVGTYNDFQNMNQIQRAMFAKSFGMQKDEFAEMLKMAELEKQFSGISAKTAREQLEIITKSGKKVDETILKNLQERAIQDQILDLTTKIKQTFIDIAQGPIGTMLKGLVGVLEKINNIAKGLGNLLGGGKDIGNRIAAIVMAIPLVVSGFMMMKSMFKFFSRGTFSNPMVTTDMSAGGGDGGSFLGDLFGPQPTRAPKGNKRYINPKTGKPYRPGAVLPKGAARKQALKSLGKKIPYAGALLMGLDYLGEMGAGKSAGEAALGTVDQNKFALAGAGLGATIGAFFGGVGALPGAGIGYGIGSIADMFAPRAFSSEMPVQDFVIKPLKKDTITMAGGTRLGNTEEIVSGIKELINTVRAGNRIDINSKSLVTYQNMGSIVSTAIA